MEEVKIKLYGEVYGFDDFDPSLTGLKVVDWELKQFDTHNFTLTFLMEVDLTDYFNYINKTENNIFGYLEYQYWQREKPEIIKSLEYASGRSNAFVVSLGIEELNYTYEEKENV